MMTMTNAFLQIHLPKQYAYDTGLCLYSSLNPNKEDEYKLTNGVVLSVVVVNSKMCKQK